MFKRVLVPLDGSEFAEQALQPALTIAEKCGSEVIVLRVVVPDELVMVSPTLSAAYPKVVDEAAKRDWEEAEAYIESIRARWADAKVPLRTEVISGAPPERILDVAQADGADLIVMSTHGRAGLSRLVYGSVAEAVLRGGRVPVLLIPIKS